MATAWQNQRLFVDTESTFGTDPSADGSGYAECYVEGLSVDLAQESIARPVHRPTHAPIPNVAGARSPTLSFQAEALGLSTIADGVEAAPHAWLSTLLTASCLSETLTTGSTVDGSSATTTEIPLDDASDIAVGTMVLVTVGTELHARCVVAKATDTITVAPALPSAPASGAKILGSASYTPDDTASPGTAAFVWKHTDFERVITGARGNVTLQADPGQRAMLGFEFSANAFAASSKASLPALANHTASPVLGRNAVLQFGTTELLASSYQFAAGATLTPFASPSGAEGRTAWNVTGRETTLTFSPAFTSSLISDFEADTERPLLLQLGTAAGRMIAIYIPKAQIVAAPNMQDVNGVTGHAITLRANEPGDATLPLFVLGVF